MPDPTVRCGCGRQMGIAARYGRGAYRCGCGAMVHINLPAPPPPPKPTGCVGERDGEPCTDRVVKTEPFRMCDYHYDVSGIAKYLEWRWMRPRELAEYFAEAQARKIKEHILWVDQLTGTRRIPGARTVKLTDRPIVYFIKSGDFVKIGATTDLTRRMQDLTLPDPVVLITLDGYIDRERQLHKQFAHLRHHREWFRLKDELLEFINAERAIHGLPGVELAERSTSA